MSRRQPMPWVNKSPYPDPGPDVISIPEPGHAPVGTIPAPEPENEAPEQPLPPRVPEDEYEPTEHSGGQIGPTSMAKPLPPVPPPIQSTDNIVIKNAPASSAGKGVHPDAVVGFGFALMIVNGFTSGQFKRIAAVITGSGSVKDKAGSAEVHKDFLVLGGEVLFIFALDILAKTGDGAKNAILALLFGLWLIWSMQNVSVINNMVKKVTP